MRDAEALQRARRDGAVGGGRAAEQIAVRGAAHQHHRLDGEGEGGDMRLRHIGDQARALAAGVARERPVAEPHLARLRREQAEQGFQQRGLAAAVRAEQRQHLAGRQRDVEIAADDAVAVADGEIVAREDHALTTRSSTRWRAAR